MIGVLRVAKDGRVVAANEAAVDFLGPCIGRRCCDVIRASDAQRFLCGTACGGEVASGRARSEERTAVIRNQLCRLACSRVGDELVVAFVPQGTSDLPTSQPLSRREREVLAGVARGQTNGELAEMLGISESTVRTHVDAARTKLGATTRAHAVALALATHQIRLD